MKPDFQKIEALFDQARLLPPAEREAYLHGACGADMELKRRVEALLAAHHEESGFLPDDPKTESPATESDEAASTEGAGAAIGRYKLLEKLGEGGFGAVWAAEQREPVKRRVALKIIKLGMDTRQVVARFEAERQALALMDHPNIAKVLDAGSTDHGRPYFVMELVKGIPITKYCEQEKLDIGRRLDLFVKVCQAIQHAHQKGIIHRDIKPSNIMVTLHDGEPVPKVIDFGIAKATQQELTEKTIYTQYSQFIGTPAYMSPEQAEMSGLDIDTRSDIYSLGVLLYELLTGTTPFETKELLKSGLDEMRKIIREREPVRPSTRLSQTRNVAHTASAPGRPPSLPSDLDWIAMKCLEKDRSRRYETANGLAMDVRRHLAHEPVVARPPSAGYRLQKAFRRHRLQFLGALGFLGVLVAGITFSGWQAIEARRAQRSAEAAQLREMEQRLAAQAAQEVASTERERADEAAREASRNEDQVRRLLYVSDMNLAQTALRMNNVGKARRLLERHRPAVGEPDLRGWEWRYLWQLTRSSALGTLTNRPVTGFSISFAASGLQLAVGWMDGRVELWDVPGRRLIRTLNEGGHVQQGRVAFSPLGSLLAATAGYREVVLHDLASGTETLLWRDASAVRWTVRDLSFSPDGSKLVVYAGSDQAHGDEALVISVATGRVEYHHRAAFSETLHHGAARLSPDNRRLYVAESDARAYRYGIRCIDLESGAELWRTRSERDYGLTALDLSPDGQFLVSGSGFEDPSIRVWDAATGGLLRRLDGHTSWVCKLRFTPDGQRLISAAADQSIRIWDAASWSEVEVLRGHLDEVHDVAASNAAELLASAGKDGQVLLWADNARTAAGEYFQLPESLRHRDVLQVGEAEALLLLPDGPASLVDLRNNTTLRQLGELGASSNILCLAGTNRLFSWDGGGRIVQHELEGARLLPRGVLQTELAAGPQAAAASLARRRIAWVAEPSSVLVQVVNLDAPERRLTLTNSVPGAQGLRFLDEDRKLALIAEDRSLRVWDVESGKDELFVESPVRDAAIADGGRALVAVVLVDRKFVVRAYDLANAARLLWSAAGRHSSRHVAVSPDGNLVATSDEGGGVSLFLPRSGQLVGVLHGHLNAAFGVAFSPDGRRLISGSGGREAAKVWDVETKQELLTLAGTGSFLPQARWSGDGNVIQLGRPWQAWRAPSWKEIESAERVADRKPGDLP
ncbi:MAG TPA: hypothetical protein DCY13_03225 [Verrucomicrobiales bacterium]|nr:hypothetical protein [Verrucomicrobiales bacterium]